MNKSDRIHKEIAQAEYDSYTIGWDAYTRESNNLIGTTLDFNDNRSGNGEQIYALASDGSNALPNASLSERAKVKEITLLYRGSTNPLESVTGKAGEVGRDWGLNNTVLGLKIGTGQRGVTGQLEASADYLKEIMEKYPNAKINIYGHSLGSMDAQYALSSITDYSRINGAYIYNGPNIYSLLWYSQKVNVSALYDKIHNYVDSEDIVGLGYKEGEGAVGQVYKFVGLDKKTVPMLVGEKIAGPLGAMVGLAYGAFADQHLWGGYDFDADGNLIDRHGRRVKAWEKPEETAMLEKVSRSKEYLELLRKNKELTIDVNQDGKLDAKFSVDSLKATPLIPVGASGEIVINFPTLLILAGNLEALLNEIAQIKELLSISEQTNADVESRKQSRTETLEQSIVRYLEQIELIKSIKKLDEFYSTLEDNKSKFEVLGEYNTYQFSRQFDWFGFSGFKHWCYQSGSAWDYSPTVKKLDKIKVSARKIAEGVKKTYYNEYSPQREAIITVSAKTDIARQGIATINSFKSNIVETFKGQGVRSKFDDGIAKPLGEVIRVEKTNMDAMEICIRSMRQSVIALADSHQANDTTIEQNWNTKQDVLGNYKVGKIPSDFNTFVEKSGLFDDLAVLKAFDKQVDDEANNLSSKMATSFTAYLTVAKDKSRNTYADLKETQASVVSLIPDFPTGIYYKEEKEEGEYDIHYYRTIEESIAVASAIKETEKLITELEKSYRDTIQTIDSAGGSLSTLKIELRNYLEDAIYNYSTLSEVIRAQRMIALVMNKINAQVISFSELVNQNKGKSIEALDGRMKELGVMTSHISELISTCFGNK